MSVVAYNQYQSADMTSYRSNVPQQVDPLAQLNNLERELEIAERRTASMIDDLARRLDNLELKVATVSNRFGDMNRELEKKVVSLAQRVNSIDSSNGL